VAVLMKDFSYSERQARSIKRGNTLGETKTAG
jgi:hypothetical protein